MFLSVFDVFKIGIGPSSSHTMGPMVAANRFLDELATGQWPRPATAQVAALAVSLHGSLAFTGIGHGTGRAVILGLSGYTPASIDPDDIEAVIARVERLGRVEPPGHPSYRFRPAVDLVYDKQHVMPGHPNGLQIAAYDADGGLLLRRSYYSIGGGFVLEESELAALKHKTPRDTVPVPYPFETAAQMLGMAKSSGLSIAEMKRSNELARQSEAELDAGLDRIWQAMSNCIDRGMSQEGQLPGGLKVRRRAKAIRLQLEAERSRNAVNPLTANDWLALYAMAVNEENAGGGKVVTAPTNGAAGVIPSVLRYYRDFATDWTEEGTRTFLLTAAAVGGIIKHNASISGAEVGCQGEVGSASAMAAAGLCAVMGGTPEQVENAAEIALEHHLGMTCDPVGGLVQIPCIERNAFGAVKAVTAASLAMKGDGVHSVALDACVETMRQTGRDMNERYKETSLGGLAVNVVEC
ncbi:L-serine ammonia-lyase [Youhaiella tibetensis]|uniref:L-serine dehydratase n=1 Tax=Paradevosia tibetensis TaxID=1447062 RepID=A0A5B9DKM6_9HYPH|nr:L-serine ammonia-lyase [Youhaiella tibetensis]AKR54681.1 L-serine dehydratase [Devosia sp. H5989]QEE19800.1 L-serine ammonia-lyase [Youhaiella tibetensis]GGF29858.1 L-serine ammonia-lyase [Youhaiella tibetensis]